MRITAHTVVPEADAAAEWYTRAFGASVVDRIPLVLQISTDYADGLWKRALVAGAEIQHELADQFWGERHGQLTAPGLCRSRRGRGSPSVPGESRDGETRNRTEDTTIFSRVLYQLSYLALGARC